MSFAAWASLPLPTTAIAPSLSEAVDSPNRVGISGLGNLVTSDRQLKVNGNGAEKLCAPPSVSRSLSKSYPLLCSWSLFQRNCRKLPYPPTPRFFTKSAESLENKRVEFLENAKKCKRVRKSVKIRGIDRRHVGTFAGLKVRTGGEAQAPGGIVYVANRGFRKRHFRKCGNSWT